MSMTRGADVLTPALWLSLLHVAEQGEQVRVTRTNGPGTVSGVAANRLSDLGLVYPLRNSHGYGRWGVALTDEGRRLVDEGMPAMARATRTFVDRGRLWWGVPA